MASPQNTPNSPTGAENGWRTRVFQPHSVFLILAAIFGFAVLAVNPPFQAPDENDHFYRAYQLSEGGIIGQKKDGNSGSELPGIVFFATDMGDIAFHSDKKVTAALLRKKWEKPFVDWSKESRRFVAFPHTVFYPAWGYLPQAIGIFVGRVAHVGPVGLLYFARLAVLIVSVALGYTALRLMPIFRWSCLVVLLAPMSLYLMGSAATDGILINSAFLLAALLLRYGLVAERAPNRKQLTLLLLVAALVTTSKVVYFPLAALALVLVLPRFESRRGQIIFAVAFVSVCLLPLAIWGRLVASLYVPGKTDIHIDPVAQVHFVMSDPLGFLALVVRSCWQGSNGIYRWFVGTLGWGDTPMPDWFFSIYGWCVLVCLIAESHEAVLLRWWQRLVVILAALISVVMLFGALYTTWNAVGSRDNIEGVGGRYFLPIAVFAILSFPPLWRLKVPTVWARYFATAFGTLSAVVCLTAVILRYYFP